MQYISQLPQKELFKGFKGRFVHTDHTTIAFWDVEKDALLPLHAHIHEQSTQILEGQFELTVNGETTIYEPGMIVVIPPNVPHSGKALSHCKILDVFCPVREDYR